jgi:hypothetical protein
MSSNVVLMFFSFIMTAIMFHLFWDTTSSAVIVSGGGDLFAETGSNHLEYIDQEFDTGFPTF